MSWLRRYFRPTWARIWAIVAAIAVFVSILGGFNDATARLEAAVEAVFPIGAALIPFVALFGIISLSALLVGAGYEWVVDRRNNGPARRKFKGLHERIDRINDSLASVGTWNSNTDRAIDLDAFFSEVAGEVEVLADELRNQGIQTPTELKPNIQSIDEWTNYVATLKAYVPDGNYQYAIRLGLDKYGRGNETPTP